MATRSEQHHADEQRKAGAKKAKARVPNSRPGVAPEKRTRAKKHAGRKATYALEQTNPQKRPSRKSTRKSANRAKADTSLNLVEGLRKGSPESRFRKEKARAGRARGSEPRN